MSGKIPAYVIDDEPIVQKTLARLLERENFEVRTFSSAEAFRKSVNTTEPHLLIVDKNLPGMSGLDLIAEHQETGHTFEAILITGYADVDSAVQALRLGIYSYVRKPFEFEALLGDVDGAVERLTRRDQPTRADPNLEPLREPLAEAGAHLKAVSRALEHVRLSPTARESLDIASQRLATADQVLGNHLVEDRLRQTGEHLALRHVPLMQVVRAAAEDLTDLLQLNRRPLWIEVEGDRVQVEVASDHEALEQLLRAIIALAAEDGEPGDPIVLDLEDDDEQVTLHVISQRAHPHPLAAEQQRKMQLCRRLATALQGEFTVMPYLETGTSYTLALPTGMSSDERTTKVVHLPDVDLRLDDSER